MSASRLKRKAPALASPVPTKAARRAAPTLPPASNSGESLSETSEDDQAPALVAKYQAESDVEDLAPSDDDSGSPDEEGGLVRSPCSRCR